MLPRSLCWILSRINDLVNQAVLLSLLGGHEIVALAVGCNHFQRLTGVVRQNVVHALFDNLQALQVDGHIGDLSLSAGGGLMDHDLRVGQSQALALGAGGEQKRAHAGSHADANSGYIALNILHRVINGHTVGDGAAGTVDVKLDVLVRVLGLQIQGGSDKKDDGATSGSDSKKDDNAISSDDKNPDASKDDVKTADVYHVMGYSVAFTMALAGIVLLVYEDRKKKRLINK